MLLFWAVFDGLGSYTLPVLMFDRGISETTIGLIIGSSSLFGALFDYVFGRFVKQPNYRRIYMVMFSICAIYPLLLIGAETVAMYILAMCVWGIYYDLFNFGNFDFVAREVAVEKHATGFGIMGVFRALGYIIAPVIGGLATGYILGWNYAVLMWLFLCMAIIAYVVLVISTSKRGGAVRVTIPIFPAEKFSLKMMARVTKRLYPVLICTGLVSIFDSFYWTIGPLFSEQIPVASHLNGLFITLYEIPALLMGWFAGKITMRYGKKKTAFTSAFLSSCLLLTFPILAQSNLIFLMVFLSSVFFALCLPSVNAAYADYISDSPSMENDIESVADLFANIGYIIGPILAGLLADRHGIANAFGFLGILGMSVSFILLRITPKKISVSP
jgi:MFS family permease